MLWAIVIFVGHEEIRKTEAVYEICGANLVAESGSREFSVKKITCDRFPSGPQKHEYKPKDIST